MALNRAELALVAAELARSLVGRPLLFVTPAGAKGWSMVFGPPLQRRRLLVDLGPRTSRVHLLSGRGLPGPRTPFVDRLEAELAGKALLELAQPSPDRWLRLVFAGDRTLILELMGPRSQAYILDDQQRVLARWSPHGHPPGALHAPPEPPRGATDPPRFAPTQPSRQIEAHYAPLAEREAREQLESIIRSDLSRRAKLLEKRILAVRGDLERTAAARIWREEGELLKSHLGALRRGLLEIEVQDYFDPALVARRIALDPTLSPSEQVEARFRRARKLESGQAPLARRLQRLEAEAERVAAKRAALEARLASANLEQLAELGRSTAATATERPPARQRALPYRVFTSEAAQPIWVGKSAAGNIELTFRHARGHHLWLHAHGVAGSHVIVPLARGQEPRPSWLRDAAELAAHFSKSKADPIDVIYTRQRFVRKLKGARLGQVAIAQEKVLRLRRDRTRLARLMQPEE
jgi:predicted ribosome quality control (RQC) complex YloA/Tae2 family protein